MRRKQEEMVESVDIPVERRRSIRFPLERTAQIRIFGRRAEEVFMGRTINISSSGILFTVDREVQPGRRAEIAVSWPVRLDNNCPLKLVARGRIVRTEPGKAALQIQQYEFRTMGSNSF